VRCDSCLNARTIVSENGYHSSCCLSEKQAMDCITKKKDSFIERPQSRSVLRRLEEMKMEED
jgi:hypothetical protein